MSRYWSDIVADLQPYVPGEQPKIANLVKLNTNENPFPPSPAVLTALQGAIGDRLRLYPDPESEHLSAVIARYYGVRPENVHVGNGSDELLAQAFQALLQHDQPVLFPDISYSFYPVYCNLYRIRYETVPLTAQYTIDLEDYIRPNGGVIFPNPNAPTGCLLTLGQIEQFLVCNSATPVVIDEAYIDFGGASAVSLTQRYPQLLVIQTLSKSRALAGLRVGYAIGHVDLIAALKRVKNSFNSYPLDYLAQTGAAAALEDQAYFEASRQKIIANRQYVVDALHELGFQVLDSAANFVFASHERHAAQLLMQQLREQGVLVRHFTQSARIANFLRITIGDRVACEALVQALSRICQRSDV